MKYRHPEHPVRGARRLLPCLLTVALALPAAAGAETLRLDPAKSKLGFHLPATGHDVEGVLALQSGLLTFDRATGEADGTIVLDAAATSTGNGSRDKKMRGEVLLADRFPKILFHARRLEGALAAAGKSQVRLVGNVDLVGVEHELTLPVEAEIVGERLTASSSFDIPFVAWGLEDPSILFLKVDPTLRVTLEVEGVLAASEPR